MIDFILEGSAGIRRPEVLQLCRWHSMDGRRPWRRTFRPRWWFPFFLSFSGGCAPIITSLSFLGKILSGHWIGGSVQLSNLKSTRCDADCGTVDQHFSLAGLRRGSREFIHPVYLYFVELEKAQDHHRISICCLIWTDHIVHTCI